MLWKNVIHTAVFVFDSKKKLRLRVCAAPLGLAAVGFLVVACQLFEDPHRQEERSLFYQQDGRSLHYAEPLPMDIDLNQDGMAEYSVFCQLTNIGGAVQINVGINPIDVNLIKSGPFQDDHFLNMGLIVAEPASSRIDVRLRNGHQWTADHSALVIKSIGGPGSSYEGHWANGVPNYLGIRYWSGSDYHHGWLRLSFDPSTDRITLLDYAYNLIPENYIKAGER